MHPAPARATENGFSLVEALIAAALFAFMLLGTLPLFLQSTQATARNRNQIHFNNIVQALSEELVVRRGINGAVDPLVTGTHVYPNTSNYYDSGGNPIPGVPRSVADAFRGTANSQSGDKGVQNNLLAQIQYQVTTEFSRTRLDIQLYYFKSSKAVKPITTICSGACDPLAAPPATLAVVSTSTYIDLTM